MNKAPRTQKCVTYILQWWNLVQLYLKKMPKIYESVTYLLSSADISIFSLEISKFYFIKKYR